MNRDALWKIIPYACGSWVLGQEDERGHQAVAIPGRMIDAELFNAIFEDSHNVVRTRACKPVMRQASVLDTRTLQRTFPDIIHGVVADAAGKALFD